MKNHTYVTQCHHNCYNMQLHWHISGHRYLAKVWLHVVYCGKRDCFLSMFWFWHPAQIPHCNPPGCKPTILVKKCDVANSITHLGQWSSPPGTPLSQFDWQVKHPPVYLWELSPGPRGCQGRCPDGRRAGSSACRGCLCGAAQIWWSDCKRDQRFRELCTIFSQFHSVHTPQ